MGFCRAANNTVSAMVDAVNEKLPTNDQFSQFWWYPSKGLRLHQEYRRLYPGGGLIRREHVFGVLMFLCLALALSFFALG
jgi:hypothetical protein